MDSLVSRMKGKRTKMQDYEQEEDDCEIPMKQYQGADGSEPGTSANMPKEMNVIELLEYELHSNQINVQEIGRIIAEGFIDKQITDEELKDFTRKVARNIHAIPNINVWNLADDLNRGAIDSRLVVIGNSFLWNLLKTSMSTVRDKFDHYHFKMSTISSGFSSGKADLISNRAREGDFVIIGDSVFRKVDLLIVFNQVNFRKNGDVFSKCKQFAKAYMAQACTPKCAIWHYSLRQSGTSHKKTLQDFPISIMNSLIHFLLTLADLAAPELDADSHEKLTPGNRFFYSLADTKEGCILEFENLRAIRENMISRFRTCVSDALNECREMPYNTTSRELMPPPRGKPVDLHHCVTWRQYETVIKRSEIDPSKENLDAKHDLELRLCISYQRDDEGQADVNLTK